MFTPGLSKYEILFRHLLSHDYLVAYSFVHASALTGQDKAASGWRKVQVSSNLLEHSIFSPLICCVPECEVKSDHLGMQCVGYRISDP